MPLRAGWPATATIAFMACCSACEADTGRPGAHASGASAGAVDPLAAGPPRPARIDERPLVPLDEMVRVSAVSSEFCGVRRDGSVWCWSQDGGRFVSWLEADGLARRVAQLDGSADIALGDGAGCVVTTAATVRCWGVLDSAGDVAEPRLVPGIDDAQEVLVGVNTACARRRDRSVWCWGDRLQERGGEAVPERPTRRFGDVDSFAISETAVCAVVGSGSVWCWGKIGEFEYAWAARATAFDALSQRARPTAIAGGAFTFCVGAGPEVACLSEGREPFAVEGFGAGKTLVRESSSSGTWSYPLCAIGEGAHVLCAGLHGSGMKTDRSAYRAQQVPGIDKASAIATTHGDVCAVTEAGAVMCWGTNRTSAEPVMRLKEP